MGLYSEPPQNLTFAEIKPTLLVCWWMTIFCFTIILLRIAGRFIRSERLFVEDRTVALAIIPLFMRMGCVHVILIYGTNNIDFDGEVPSESDRRHRAIGSGLVLASRIFHAATLWIFKITILEFFKRISDALSERFSQFALVAIRFLLVATFVAIIISDLAECQPFTHYWQVYPDPGGHCRQGFAQLLTMSVCNVVTDLLLVLFPIPIIFFSRQSMKRKVQLILLFSLSLGVVGATIYRATRVIQDHGNQQLRSLLASVELLFATAAANSLVLGSFVRDRGVKKKKFRAGSFADSMERTSTNRSRRPTANRHWGSDEDLVRGLGLGVQPELRNTPDTLRDDEGMFDRSPGTRSVRPAPVVRVDDTANNATVESHNVFDARDDRIGGIDVDDLNAWEFPDRRRSGATNSARSAQSGVSGVSVHSDDDALLGRDLHSSSTRNNSTSTPRKVSFYDAGNLLGGDSESEAVNMGAGLRPSGAGNGTRTRPSSDNATPSPVHTASSRGFRRGSTALLHDLGGLLGPPSRQRQRSDVRSSTLETVPQETSFQMPSPRPSSVQPASPGQYSPSDFNSVNLMDAGGLLR